MVKKVILGGTFHKLHKGHKKMLITALEIGDVKIGLVSDNFLSRWKPELEAPYAERKKELKDHLSEFDNWEIVEISDPYSEALKGEYDVLVVSWDTKKRGKKINEMRKERGEKPLELVVVPPVMAEDLIPISSSRIREGRISRSGKRLTPVKIHVETQNPIKLEQVRNVFSEFFEFEITSKSLDNIKPQSFEDETIKQAKKRAAVPRRYDYGVGIESGIFYKHGIHFSMEYAVVIDSVGYETVGHGPGFTIPKSWVEKLEHGETLGRLIENNFSISHKGAVEVLSANRLTRAECIKNALICSIIPRIHLYTVPTAPLNF